MIVQAINRSIEPFPFVRPPFARQERDLEKVIKLITLFEPFILHNNHIFEAANVERLSAALPEESWPISATTRARWIGGTTGSTCTFRHCASGAIL